jgi:glycosyltransferase involved in cell wall biosynthesis
MRPADLRGYLDEATRTRIRGWAWNADDPDAALTLEVLDNDVVIARVRADRHRGDLAADGIGTGHHAFDLAIPGGLSPLTAHTIAVRQADGGPALTHSPRHIPPAPRLEDGLAQAVAGAVAALDDAAAQDRALDFLAAQMARLRRHPATPTQAARIGAAPIGAAPIGGKAARRALVIDDEVPAPDRDAGSQAILSHMRALQDLGFAVSFAAAQEFAENGPGVAALEAQGIQCCRLPDHAAVEDVLRGHAAGFDLIYLHRLSNAAKYLALARRDCPRARIVYAVADLHHLRIARQAAVEAREDLLAESRKLFQAERRAALAADVVVTHSAPEAALLRRAAPSAAVHVVPWAVVPWAMTPRTLAGSPDVPTDGVAFIANYGHPPNVDAARHLVDDIMPLVWARAPAIPCLLAGSRMPAAIRRLARPGAAMAVQTLGHVADLSALFGRVRLTVAPLRFGAGLKGKVLDSLAGGVPCVMTPVAAEGIDLPPPLSDLVGGTPAALADRIIRLHGDQAACRALGQAGRALVATEFSPAKVAAALQAAIEPPCNGGLPAGALAPCGPDAISIGWI